MTNTIRLFISHASDDVELATRVVALFRAALNLPAASIRCTSVDGYRLEGGADTDEVVRSEINSADAFIGILSDRSMQSKYVLIELGARWGLGKHLLPLLAPGTSAGALGGPLRGKNALKADRDAQLHQMLREVGRVLQIDPEPPEVYLEQLRGVVAWLPPSLPSAAPLPIDQPAPTRVDRVRSRDLEISAGLDSPAIRLLKESAEDPKGMILHGRTHNSGTSIHTNGKQFAEPNNPKSAAEWEAALDQLEKYGLVTDRRGTRDVFYITDAGYRVAATIIIVDN